MDNKPQKRIQLIDAARGLAVILMVAHHALFDAVEFLGAPAWCFENPVFGVLHPIFAGLFIFLCGVSSRFSRSNVKRGLKTASAAAVISIVTYFIEMPIIFGILHLLAVCMIMYGLCGKAIERIPRKLAGVLWAAMIVVSAIAVRQLSFDAPLLWVLGWTRAGFYSADYFPLLPWIFVFLLGTWAGEPIRESKLPQWFYDAKVKWLPSVGRKSFIIYLVHQPLLYGITMLILHLKK